LSDHAIKAGFIPMVIKGFWNGWTTEPGWSKRGNAEYNESNY
jgi:hypothetical protein